MFPDWDKMTDQQKLEALKEWAERLDARTRQHGSDLQHLHERLKTVEGKVADKA